MTLVTIENKVICQEFGHNYVMLPKHKADVSKLNSVYECSIGNKGCVATYFMANKTSRSYDITVFLVE